MKHNEKITAMLIQLGDDLPGHQILEELNQISIDPTKADGAFIGPFLYQCAEKRERILQPFHKKNLQLCLCRSQCSSSMCYFFFSTFI